MWCSPESDRTLSCLGTPVILYITTSIENIMQQPPQCAWGSVAIGDWRNNCQRQDWQLPWCLERHQHATHLPNGSPNGSTDPTQKINKSAAYPNPFGSESLVKFPEVPMFHSDCVYMPKQTPTFRPCLIIYIIIKIIVKILQLFIYC